jgi:O-antigen/teichoic acid export membrane protein
LLLALVAMVARPSTMTPILAGVVVGYLTANILGWSHARLHQGGYAQLDRALIFREGLASVSIGLAVQLLWQLERVAIPKLASVNDLATYSVLAAVVGAPFRVTQFGVRFTLIERLRSAPDADAARTILRHEIVVALLLVLAAVVGVLIVAPIVFHTMLRDKYTISSLLMAVTITVGVVRVAEAFTTTAVTALGTVHSLARMSTIGWISLGVAIIGATLGSRAGLVGIVSGTLVGWVTLCGGGCVLAVMSFRQRFPAARSHAAGR